MFTKLSVIILHDFSQIMVYTLNLHSAMYHSNLDKIGRKKSIKQQYLFKAD